MANYKQSNHTITPREDDDVTFVNNQSMSGNKITNAADATLDHDYITKNQLDNHSGIHTVTTIHNNSLHNLTAEGQTAWPTTTPGDSPGYAPKPHNHGYSFSNSRATNGYQWLGKGLMQWGETENIYLHDDFNVDGGHWNARDPYGDLYDSTKNSLVYLATGSLYDQLNITFPLPFDNNCLNVQITIGVGDNRVNLYDPTSLYYDPLPDGQDPGEVVIGLKSYNPTGCEVNLRRYAGYQNTYNFPLDPWTERIYFEQVMIKWIAIGY